jgi:hypothetical protein
VNPDTDLGQSKIYLCQDYVTSSRSEAKLLETWKRRSISRGKVSAETTQLVLPKVIEL